MARSPEPRLAPVSEQRAQRAPPSPGSASGSSDEEDSEVYEVEAIRASRWDGDAGAKRYFVKWKGWPEDQCTWEPEENLDNCPEIVRAYERKKAEREAKAKNQMGGRTPEAETGSSARQTPGSSKGTKTAAKASSKSKKSNDSDDERVRMKEWEARREQAKKKSKQRTSQIEHSEDAVARKWEKKAATKEGAKSRTSTSTSASTSPAKRKAPKPAADISKTTRTIEKRAAEQIDSSQSSVAPQKRPRIADSSESETEDARQPLFRSLPSTGATDAEAPRVRGSAADQRVKNSDDEATGTQAARSDRSPSLAAPAPPYAAGQEVTTIDPRATLLNGSSSEAPDASPIVTVSGASERPQVAPPPAEPKRTAHPLGPWAPGGALHKVLSNRSFRIKKAEPETAPRASTGHQEPPESRVRFASGLVVSTNTAGSGGGRSISPAGPPVSALKQPTNGGATPLYPANPSKSPPNLGSSTAAPPVPPSALNGNGPNVLSETRSSAHLGASTAPPPANGASTAPSPANGASTAPPPANGASPAATSPAGPAGKDGRTEEEREQRQSQRLAMEDRLRSLAWCQAHPAFIRNENMFVACAECVPVDSALILRLRRKSVALADKRGGTNEAMVGESLALAYVLLDRGATTPDAMHELDALFLHRDQPVAELHRIYCELVNLDHHVEFFHFGKEAPIETIFGSGYLVIPMLSAMQIGATFRRYCETIGQVYGATCMTTVHPASIARARSLPNIIKNIQNGVDAGQIAVVDRQGLSADSDLAALPPEDLLDPSLAVAALIPDRSLEEETAEILQDLIAARVREPTMWRRFVIVVSELEPALVERARLLGIEAHTWGALSSYVEANPFG
ncbi:hypothetical protein JCM8202_004680 [Rhodotorula sphaerocarpa]